MTHSDDKERREAEELRKALDGEPVDQSALPEDALETAALLEYTATGGELDPKAEERILDEILKAKPETSHQPKIPWPWISGLAAAGAVAAALLLVVVPMANSPEPTAQTPTHATVTIPPPGSILLTAQAEAIDGVSTEAFDAEMAVYRKRLFSTLKEAAKKTALLQRASRIGRLASR